MRFVLVYQLRKGFRVLRKIGVLRDFTFRRREIPVEIIGDNAKYVCKVETQGQTGITLGFGRDVI